MNKTKFKAFDRVLVRVNDMMYWQAGFFEFESDGWFCVINGSVKYPQCIPYKSNEHLLGTTDSPEKPEPWKPKDGEMYYCIAWSVSSGFFTVRSHWNSHEPFDTDAWEAGNCFRTEEDAQQVIDRMNEALEGILSPVPGRLFDRE